MRKLYAVMVSAFMALTLSGCVLMNQQERECTVTDKESVTVRSSDGNKNQYRVYTEECGTLTIEDTLVGFRYDSADVYGDLQPGETYTFKTGGFRSGPFSMFPNILEVK